MDRLKKAITEATIGEATKGNVIQKAKALDKLIQGKDLDDPEIAAEVLSMLNDYEEELELVGESHKVNESTGNFDIGMGATISMRENSGGGTQYVVKGSCQSEDTRAIKNAFEEAVKEIES